MLEHISIGNMDFTAFEQSSVLWRRHGETGAPYKGRIQGVLGWTHDTFFDAVMDDFGTLVPVN